MKFASGKHVHAMNTPLNPTKLGYAGIYLFFLCLVENKDCRLGEAVPTIYDLSKHIKTIRIFTMNIPYFAS